ncbi:MAG: ABC transporter permease [candidate division NC10 bacterium]|nr:ABC transporter permease [candidate division NC10 bacterium]
MPHRWPTRRAVRVWERNLTVFRKYSLPSLIGPSIGEPLLYLLGLGFGLGTLVGTVGGLRYVEFVAPGMVMSSTMFAAAYECTYGAYVRMIHQRTYEAIITTPLSLEDVVAGDILWGASKGAFNGTVMLAVVGLFGLAPSPWTLAVPVIIALLAVLFACLSQVVAALAKSFEFFNYYLTLVITPMFLFCGVFFPLESLPRWAQGLARFLPLTYAVEATRALMRGRPSAQALLPILWLVPPTIVAFLLAARLVRRRLIH